MLITGAGGFVGSRLCKHFESKGHEVVACDNFRFGSQKTLEGFKGMMLAKDFSLIKNDELDGVDVVFHEAAISDPTFKSETEITETNFKKASMFMDLCCSLGIHFIYASSSAVYGNTEPPNVEFMGEKPHNAYAASKLMLDRYAMEKMKNGNRVIGLRYFNIYGPGEEFKGHPSSIVFHFLKSFLSGSPPVIFGDGKQRRDFIYIEDILRANELALSAKENFIVNVGSGKAVSFNGLYALMANELGMGGIKPTYKQNPFPNNYQYNVEASLELCSSRLGFSPSWGLENGIKEFAAYLRSVL
jgi:ADP-L-glycero-D-manno-heptose 6-epimerase